MMTVSGGEHTHTRGWGMRTASLRPAWATERDYVQEQEQW
jgi:hypothetical protein